MIRHRALTVIIAVVVILASASVAFGANAENVSQPTRSSGATAAATSRETARFTLQRPVTLAEVAAELSNLDIDRVELVSEDTIGGITYTSGVVFDATDLSSDAYIRETAATFVDMATEFARSASNGTSDVDSLAMADAMKSAARSVGATDARIKALVVTGSDEALRELAGWVLVGGSTTTPRVAGTGSTSAGDAQVGSGARTQDAGSGGNCNNAWWPYTGSISTQYSSYQPNRYVYQRFMWSQWRIDNLYDCDGFNTSYEHEAWYNNYDGSLFLSSDVKAWSSNLPDGYLDTGLLDGDGELSMTIGTGAAYQLDAGVYYTTYIRTAPGNATSDTGKVNGQRGLNLCPIGFTGGWCVSARGTEKLLPAWNHSAPGLTYWTHY